MLYRPLIANLSRNWREHSALMSAGKVWNAVIDILKPGMSYALKIRSYARQGARRLAAESPDEKIVETESCEGRYDAKPDICHISMSFVGIYAELSTVNY